jgi:hypothetical protein
MRTHVRVTLVTASMFAGLLLVATPKAWAQG